MQTPTVLHDQFSSSEAQDARERESAREILAWSQVDIRLVTDTGAIEKDWRRLEAMNRNSLHQGYDWCRAWGQALGRRQIAIEGRIGERSAFILPLEIVPKAGIRVAAFPGDHYNNLNTGLFDPALGQPDAQMVQTISRAISRALRPVADLMVLDCVPLVWRGGQHPLAGLATIENQNHSFQLPLFANFDATIEQLNFKTRRKKFRAQTRKLEAIGGYDHFVPETPDEKHALLDTFFRQKSERLKLFGLPDVFEASEIRNFFHRLLDAPTNGTDSPLVLHSIRLKGEHAGHIAAIAGLSRKGDHVICQFSSIDETICPEASPGELLFWTMIEQSCHKGAAIFDFGVGDQLYKRSWCTQETVLHDLLVPVTLKGRVAKPLLTLSTRMKAAIKGNPRLYAFAQKLRSKAHAG
ncbi:GNAT family N-acetyltransferase [Neorhizobium alkalisoli]|uniref:CelD/BcsL family acetyltransferase involved in cellulose biosynthesis n=1 Tax=Neorhizobium alkalisoli TaxID=528178 RepID=A0A561R2A1_9HYPH|nr:GNAT family N-acetyltransferase [Neorhizobium alkalisoli]TWF56693.1 CelD/BcsL family acetyltransferase involved in cellulose biosynthesis [Neorhizobium alkalisoli]